MKKLLMKSCALVLSGTFLISCNSCFKSDETKKFPRLNGKYSLEGYYLTDTPFEGLYVIEIDGKLRLIDENRFFITTNGRYEKNENTKVYEIYSFLNKDLLNINKLTKDDYIELEKYINGITDVSFIDNDKKKCTDPITDEEKYYYGDRDIYYYNADSNRIEILFLDGIATKVVRRIERGFNGKTEDMLSGTVVNPSNREPEYPSFDRKMMEQYGNSNYEYIPLSTYFDKELKEVFTGEEIKDLYYLINGKTKDEVKEILSKSNINEVKIKELKK